MKNFLANSKCYAIQNQYYAIKKHRRQANQKHLSNQDIQTIKEEFKNWLLGIEEDEPLPHEISCICLCFNFSNNGVCLSVCGFENTPSRIDYGSFCPLEAQFFNCELLNAFTNNKNNFNRQGKLLVKIKQTIFEMFISFLESFFDDKSFSYLDSKTILIGEFLQDKYKTFKFHTA